LSITKPRDLGASVRDRLMTVAKSRQEDFGLVLTKFGMERLLYRLSQSKYHDQFILKGALLFEVWTRRPHRPTRDIDLLGGRSATVAEMKRVFGEICEESVQDDGLVFLSSLFEPKESGRTRLTKVSESAAKLASETFEFHFRSMSVLVTL